jgi:hypothetical protein
LNNSKKPQAYGHQVGGPFRLVFVLLTALSLDLYYLAQENHSLFYLSFVRVALVIADCSNNLDGRNPPVLSLVSAV